MLHTLSAQQLTYKIPPQQLGFSDTSTIVPVGSTRWIGQEEAEKAAKFGLNMKHPGFHLLVLGEPGSGRTSLMLNAMHQVAAQRTQAVDLVLLFNFESPEKPLAVYLTAGQGTALRNEMDSHIRQLAKMLPVLLNDGASGQDTEKASDKPINDVTRKAALDWINTQLGNLATFQGKAVSDNAPDGPVLAAYIAALKQDLADNLELFASGINADNEGLMESFLSRYRINLLVDNRRVKGAPVIYDDDPSFSSLFGGYESGNDNANSAADFMRVRAGNLLRAHGGMLMLHLRDIQADQQGGSQILEKLHRVLRNRRVQIEESAGTSGQNSASHFAPEALSVDVKLVLIASREEYYALHDELPDFAQYFSIKVDFSERFEANQQSYQYVAKYIATQCSRLHVKHFTAAAVSRLIEVMQRKIDDQARISANFGYLQNLLLECAVYAESRRADVVDLDDVISALNARLSRYQQPEQQLAESIADGELTIAVHGTAVGQINGLTHIDLGDACFGSPVRISARCYAGDEGVINIDREVEMTGPNHDKGLFILRSWLSSHFMDATPLSLSASLVFEQEYHGVEGDSASCAELYALISALSGVAIPQSLAVTGAMNQHGEVMAIGGVNEKIEGYYRICKRLGLDGTQGVVIPARNQSHLLLDADVITAVEQGQFHIYTVDTVLDGMSLFTSLPADDRDEAGQYKPGTVLGLVQQKLEALHKLYAANKAVNISRAS